MSEQIEPNQDEERMPKDDVASKATLDDLLCQPLGEDKLRPEWYDQEPVMVKRVGDTSYEMWATGTFGTTSPDGDRFKGHDSAHDWLIERNVTDDQGLVSVLRNEGDWYSDMNRWFELIVYKVVRKNGIDHMHELYSGDEIYDEFDAEVFVDMINNAIERDAEEEE